MKIIDLLNKMANGEEVPKKIKWEDTIFVYSEYDKDYLEYPFSDEEYQGLFCMKDSILTQFLDDEVEILEEEKKITPTDFENLGYALGSIQKYINKGYNKAIEEKKIPEKLPTNKLGTVSDIKNKINEIIDYLKEKENK